MAVSIFDLFKIGIGPSSSHTVGPMKAACVFTQRLERMGFLHDTRRIRVSLYGSLAHTGRGHGTDKAVMLGLQGAMPDTIDPDHIDAALERIRAQKQISLQGVQPVTFDEKTDLVFRKRELLPHHPNGMRFEAFDAQGAVLESREYYSVGGGFVVNQDKAAEDRIVADQTKLPFPFRTGDELLALCAAENRRISDIMLANEVHLAATGRGPSRPAANPGRHDGLHGARVPPGRCASRRPARSSGVPRRLYQELNRQPEGEDPLSTLDWVNLYALAVNEENAAGGRVVTAPTNGAAGVVPAVIRYYCEFVNGASEDGVIEFLLTAGAIGILYIRNASISGAEVGCQGEVGVACSMAAGGLTAAMGGTLSQVENAAEIGMEHNLGLTCDPVGGLVQIPCIERNAMAAVKAINAQRMAARGDGKHRVSLDKVIKTMRETGADMKSHYKETSRGGLAVNVIEC